MASAIVAREAESRRGREAERPRGGGPGRLTQPSYGGSCLNAGGVAMRTPLVVLLVCGMLLPDSAAGFRLSPSRPLGPSDSQALGPSGILLMADEGTADWNAQVTELARAVDM